MTPIIVNALGGGYVIYMRPAYSLSVWQMRATDGERFDPIERALLKGGIPNAMERVPVKYPTREAAEQSLKMAA